MLHTDGEDKVTDKQVDKVVMYVCLCGPPSRSISLDRDSAILWWMPICISTAGGCIGNIQQCRAKGP